MDLELYLCFKIQKMNAWCIRPSNWAGVWNGNKELCEGRYTALFNTEEEAKQVCEQLNQAYYKDQIIREARELVKNSSWRLDDVHDLIDGYNELDEILDRNVK